MLWTLIQPFMLFRHSCSYFLTITLAPNRYSSRKNANIWFELSVLCSSPQIFCRLLTNIRPNKLETISTAVLFAFFLFSCIKANIIKDGGVLLLVGYSRNTINNRLFYFPFLIQTIVVSLPTSYS